MESSKKCCKESKKIYVVQGQTGETGPTGPEGQPGTFNLFSTAVELYNSPLGAWCHPSINWEEEQNPGPDPGPVPPPEVTPEFAWPEPPYNYKEFSLQCEDPETTETFQPIPGTVTFPGDTLTRVGLTGVDRYRFNYNSTEGGLYSVTYEINTFTLDPVARTFKVLTGIYVSNEDASPNRNYENMAFTQNPPASGLPPLESVTSENRLTVNTQILIPPGGNALVLTAVARANPASTPEEEIFLNYIYLRFTRLGPYVLL